VSHKLLPSCSLWKKWQGRYGKISERPERAAKPTLSWPGTLSARRVATNLSGSDYEVMRRDVTEGFRREGYIGKFVNRIERRYRVSLGQKV
jgi:hypothetical protein